MVEACACIVRSKFNVLVLSCLQTSNSHEIFIMFALAGGLHMHGRPLRPQIRTRYSSGAHVYTDLGGLHTHGRPPRPQIRTRYSSGAHVCTDLGGLHTHGRPPRPQIHTRRSMFVLVWEDFKCTGDLPNCCHLSPSTSCWDAL